MSTVRPGVQDASSGILTYPQYFGLLTDLRAESLEDAIADSVLEGFAPTEDDIRDLGEVTLGHITDQGILARGRSRYARASNGSRPAV